MATISCDTASLVAAGQCFDCIPDGFLPELETYFMAVKAGGSTEPSDLITQSSPYLVLMGAQLQAQVYLLAILSGVSPTAESISAAAQCGECIPTGYKDYVDAALWQQISGAPFDPSTTPLTGVLARYQMLLGMNSAVQTMLLNQIANTGMTPAQLATASGCLYCVGVGVLQDAYTKMLCNYLNHSTPPDNRITWSPASVGGTYNGGTPFANLADFRAVDPLTVTDFEIGSAGSIDSISNIPTLANAVTITIQHTAVPAIDVTGMVNMVNLLVGSNASLASLNVTGCTSVGTLLISGDTSLHSITGLADLSVNASDFEFNASGLTSLSIPNFSGLTTLNLANCSSLTSLVANGCASLSTLALNNDTALTTLNLTQCGSILSLNISTCGNVNSLTLAQCVSLQILNCSGNKLATLDISDCASAYSVNASNNLLTSFVQPSAFVAAIGLYDLNFTSNKLTSLDISNYSSNDFNDMLARNNLLPQAAVDAVLSALATVGGAGVLCDLAGTGNAAPSAGGLADKGTMIANGWTTVNTN